MPTHIKTPVDKVLDALAEEAWGISRSDAWKKGICIACKKPIDVTDFTDLDRQEYQQSALCPACFTEYAAKLADLDK